ncbi:MAG TPA: hypothetical protein VKX49_12345 [Bryobacteraceae bacterium]|nr:hypothetical protein [Bryobacteraceae bacterium]
MKRVGLALTAAALAHLGCNGRGDRVTFRVKAADVQHQSNSFLKNKQPADSIEITLPGKLLNPPVAVTLIGRDQADWSTPEHAAQSILSAGTSGDASWVVESYVSAERAEVSRRLAQPDALERIRNYYRALGKVSETCSVEINGYRALFLQAVDPDGDTTLIAIALAHTPDGWRQTDALARDDTFEIAWAALHTGGAR